MLSENFYFDADEQRLAATRHLPQNGGAVRIMTLHGLGPTATRHTLSYIVNDLSMRGHGALCFEFSGNGESTGVLREATLKRRRAEALCAAKQLDAGPPPVLIGTSMGGHLAASITPQLQPAALVLFCPAAYPAAASEQPFDEAFAKPGPHADSPAFAGLREFEGELLIIGAREDKVVSAATVEAYLACATKARRREIIWLEGCDHFIHRWLPHQEQQKNKVLAAIGRLVDAAPLAH